MKPPQPIAQAWCSGCLALRRVDRHWRALYIDSDGDFISTQPEHGCDIDYERPGTVFVCGQGCALALFERYLHSRSFEVAHDFHLDLAESHLHYSHEL